MIRARILGTGSFQPGRVVTNEELAATLPGGRSAREIEERTGIYSRNWVPAGTRMSTLGADGLRLALADARMKPEELRRLIYVSTVGGDTLSPASANQVALELGIVGTSDAFDVNNACLGFLTSLDIAARSAATGLSPTGIAVVEVISDQLVPEDPRPYLVGGDAVAGVVVGEGRPGEGILAVYLGNRGDLGGTVYMPHPRGNGVYVRGTFTKSNKEMGQMALELVLLSVREVFKQSGLGLDDMAWVLPHQPNGALFEAIVGALAVPREKLVPVVRELGSTGAASIPVSLDRLRRAGKVAGGDRILMVSVGSGVGYGAMIYQEGAG